MTNKNKYVVQNLVDEIFPRCVSANIRRLLKNPGNVWALRKDQFGVLIGLLRPNNVLAGCYLDLRFFSRKMLDFPKL